MKTLFSQNCIEFFRDPDTFDVFFLKDNQIYPFPRISIDDAESLREDLEKNPVKLKALKNAGIHDPFDQIRFYAGCVFGSFTNHPDFVMGKRHSFYLNSCKKRDGNACLFSHKLCDRGKLVLKNLTLTARQVEILRITSEDIPETEAASRLFISVATLKRHKSTLRKLLNVRSSISLALFSRQFIL